MSGIDKSKKECKTLSIAIFFMGVAQIALGVFTLVMGTSEGGSYLAGGPIRIVGGVCIFGYALLVLKALKGSNNFVMRIVLIVAGIVCSNLGNYMVSDNSWWVNSFIAMPLLVEYYINSYKKLSEEEQK